MASDERLAALEADWNYEKTAAKFRAVKASGTRGKAYDEAKAAMSASRAAFRLRRDAIEANWQAAARPNPVSASAKANN